MNIRDYVDGLFERYRDDADMMDFKEEVCGNLQERMDYLVKRGATKDEAFKKATTELGDISEIADQISNHKRKEVIEAMYMKTRNYMDKWHVIGYTAAGGLLAFGIISGLVAFLHSGEIMSLLGTLIPFFIVPVCGFVFLGLTQETARNYPMNGKRALLYMASVGVILFGMIVFTRMLFFTGETGLPEAVASLIPFVLPGSILLGFLLLTEKSRHKPWVVEQEAAWAERMGEPFADPYVETRFGLYSGALWLFAIALFVTLGFILGFQYSWPVFLFAVAIQVLLQALMMPKDK